MQKSHCINIVEEMHWAEITLCQHNRRHSRRGTTNGHRTCTWVHPEILRTTSRHPPGPVSFTGAHRASHAVTRTTSALTQKLKQEPWSSPFQKTRKHSTVTSSDVRDFCGASFSHRYTEDAQSAINYQFNSVHRQCIQSVTSRG